MDIELFLLAIFSCFVTRTSCKTQKFFEVLRFESCSNYPDLPIQLTRGRKLGTNNNNRSIELTLLVKETIGGKIDGIIDLWKCDVTGLQNSCEYYVKELKVRKICEKIPMKDQLWSPLTDNIIPKLGCPIKANTYEVNCPISNDTFRFMPVPSGVWKARGLMFSDDKKVCCVDFHGRVLERRV